jgi:acetoin utilization protein AcuC
VAVPATDPCQPARLRHAPAGSLANLELSIDAQRAAHAAIHALSHDLAGGRWLLTGGGGYELVQVVPRAWTHLIAEAAASRSTRVPPPPLSWREYPARRTGLAPPRR